MYEFSELSKMKPSFQLLILFLTIFLVPPPAAASCNQTCGGRKLPFPFGFSSDCGIQLNCTSNATILAGEFPVQDVTDDTILINLPATCRRPVAALGRLFTQNYAPTSRNAILLQNCSSRATACSLPTTTVKTNFELLDCGVGNDSISCYSETDIRKSFIDYRNLTRSGCRSLFSAISMKSSPESVSLDVQIVRMGWWLLGECRCSENAKCVKVSPPVDGNPPAFRCECSEGFTGDGFREGLGCRRECNTARYVSGQCGGTTRVGVLVGGIAAGASLMVISALIFFSIRRSSKLRSRSRKNRDLLEKAGITIPIYTYTEMEKATDNFSDKKRLGNGAYGTVYAGKLSHTNELVAIKRIKHTDNSNIINEIKLLSSVSHPNLVRLLGCSVDNQQQILIYEFMPYGTLSEHLQREKGKGTLPWPIRLKIACETAQAISYLHNEINPPIFHRDVKSSNILLDYDYGSKVADFGLSRIGRIDYSHVSTGPQGTPGYLDPQYHQNFHLSDKSDVYSFGVVLAEIITGLRAVDFGRDLNEVNLSCLAMDRIGRDCLGEIIDPCILEPDADNSWIVSSVHRVAELAFRCLAFHRDMRPSMMEVAFELEQIRTRMMELSSPSSSDEKREFGSRGESNGTSSSDKETGFSPAMVQESGRSDRSSSP